MATKRIICEVDEKQHARLKAEAAQLGISLGSHCASILEKGSSLPSPVEDISSSVLSSLTLAQLREMSNDLLEQKPLQWERKMRTVTSEIRRRFMT